MAKDETLYWQGFQHGVFFSNKKAQRDAGLCEITISRWDFAF